MSIAYLSLTASLPVMLLAVHRKRCERDGKYLEARAASVRLAELKTQEAQRMRQAIMERQVSHSQRQYPKDSL